MLDFEALAQPAPSEPPSGPNLQYSPEYANLERAAAGKPERQVGAAIVPAEPPDWRAVRDQSSALLASSKDLRIAVLLVRSLVETVGLRGPRRWPEARSPPGRGAVGHSASAARFGGQRRSDLPRQRHGRPDPHDVLQAIRSAPLVTSKAFGSVSLRALDGDGSPARRSEACRARALGRRARSRVPAGLPGGAVAGRRDDRTAAPRRPRRWRWRGPSASPRRAPISPSSEERWPRPSKP